MTRKELIELVAHAMAPDEWRTLAEASSTIPAAVAQHCIGSLGAASKAIAALEAAGVITIGEQP